MKSDSVFPPVPELLKDLHRLIRTGFMEDRERYKTFPLSTTKRWEENVSEILRSIAERPSEVDSLPEHDQVRLKSLEAEFYDSTGRREPSIAALAPLFSTTLRGTIPDRWGVTADPIAHAGWQGLSDAERQELGVEGSRRLVRQWIWARMMYVWTTYYRAGRYELAMRELRFIRDVIDRELVATSPKGQAHSWGTRSRWHFFYGHCLQARREFLEAEREFAQAQDAAHARLKHKLENQAEATGANRDYEIRFSVICTARILNDLGRLELQQGRLARARQYCGMAETLIQGTGQEFMKTLIRTRRAISDRRRTDPSTAACLRPLDELRECCKVYEELGDLRGQVTCERELARGFIDYVVYGHLPRPTRDAMLRSAAKSLDQLEKLSHAEPSSREDSALRLRLGLLRTKYFIAAGDLAKARDVFDATEASIRSNGRTSRRDIEAMRGLLLLHEGNTDQAIEVLSQLLQNLTNDPLVEAECHLLLAECHVTARSTTEAVEDHLRAWYKLADRVENAYLRCADRRIKEKLEDWKRDFYIRANEEDLSWERWEPELKSWLLRTARSRLGSDATLEDLGKVIKTSASTLSRWTADDPETTGTKSKRRKAPRRISRS